MALDIRSFTTAKRLILNMIARVIKVSFIHNRVLHNGFVAMLWLVLLQHVSTATTDKSPLVV